MSKVFYSVKLKNRKRVNYQCALSFRIDKWFVGGKGHCVAFFKET
jgi:hypothetical protein